jgi:hypothetical protein
MIEDKFNQKNCDKAQIKSNDPQQTSNNSKKSWQITNEIK